MTMLLERERELAGLSVTIERGRGGDGAALLLEGPAGIGKTVLLEEGCRLAKRTGMSVLVARGSELEVEFPFTVVRQLFEPAVAGLQAHARSQVLSGAAELAAPLVAGGGAPRFEDGDRSFAMLHSLYWLTSNLAERTPLLIAVDDLHWADAASLRFLRYLMQRLTGLAVTVLGCARLGEPTPEPTLLAQFRAEPPVELLRPAALSPLATATLIELHLGERPDEQFTLNCAAATGGVPFLLRELLRALSNDDIRPSADEAARVGELGPAAVARATLLRISRLPAATGSVARAVAVLGPAAEPRRIAALAEVELSEALEAADALVAVEILAPGEPLRFAHPIVRAAVYEDLPWGERASAHARAAELLHGEGAEIDVVAGHLLLSPSARPEVVELLRSAAAGALARGAPETGVAYLRRAAAEGMGREPRAALIYELARMEKLTSPPRAIEHLGEVQRLSLDPVLRARAGGELGTSLIFAGEWERGVATVDAALAELGDRDRELTVQLQGFVACAAAYDPRRVAMFDERRPLLAAALDDGIASARAPALARAAVASLHGEDLAQVVALVERGFQDGHLFGEESTLLLVAQGLVALIVAEELERAERAVEELLRAARGRGSLQAFVTGMAHRAWAQARRGQLVAAEADLRATLEPAQEHQLAFVLPSLVLYGVDPLLERPELDDVAGLAQSLTLPEDFAATLSGAFVLLTQGRLRHGQRDVAGAIQALRECGRIMEGLGFSNPNAVAAWRSPLALALAAEDPVEARRLADSELQDALRIGVPRAIGVSLRTIGMLEGGASGLPTLREAVAVLAGSPARLEHARALVELGAALRRANRRTESRGPLADGLQLARHCGATRLADRARTELLAAGARPRREVRTGVDALTASELRIAQMAATGMSNPQIGQALFVTRNTVETHMRHILQKLDLRSREELPGALGSRLSDKGYLM